LYNEKDNLQEYKRDEYKQITTVSLFIKEDSREIRKNKNTT
jgi:hypothetical protein